LHSLTQKQPPLLQLPLLLLRWPVALQVVLPMMQQLVT
jgi:hypothetical protein